METANKSLLIFAILGIISGVFWIFYVFDPLNPLYARLGLAINGAWVVGDVAVLATAAGIHIHHRRN